MRTILAVVVVLALGCVPVAFASSPAKRQASTTSVKKKACPVKRRGESKRARARRRACVARRRRSVSHAGVSAPVVVTPAPAPPAAPIVPVAPVAPIAAVPAPAPVLSTLGVDAFDLASFVLRLTRPVVPAGTLTIYFRNRDVSQHNLWIDGPGLSSALLVSGAVGEGGAATLKLAVSPGSWRLYCSLPGHEAMSTTLTVG